MTASIVQAKNVILDTTNAAITLGAAPTNGNLLVAFVYTQATSGGHAYSVQANWNAVAPYDGVTGNYIWASGPWGEHAIYWKAAGGSESATQTPLIVTGAEGLAVTMFEIANPGGTFAEVFYTGGATNLAVNNSQLGQVFTAGNFPSNLTVHSPATANTLVLGAVMLWNTSTAFVGSGPSNTVTSTAGTTSDGWPIGGTPKSASLIGYYHSLAPSASVTLSGSAAVNGTVVWIALHADSISGGGGISDIPITTTVVVPSVQAPSFKYTLIT